MNGGFRYLNSLGVISLLVIAAVLLTTLAPSDSNRRSSTPGLHVLMNAGDQLVRTPGSGINARHIR